MKTRTFTVLFLQTDEDDTTDEEAFAAFRDALQETYDSDPLSAPGSNFLIVEMRDGDEEFWETHRVGGGVVRP